jgi:putative DNA primase/helicase
MATYHDLPSLAKALGGEVSAGQVLAPGPGHSAADRSMSVKLDANAPDGLVVNSFAGDDPIKCKDYVRERAGLPAWKPNGRKRASADTVARALAAAIAAPQSEKPRGQIVATYDYVDAGGALLYQVLRYEPKDFRQRQPDGKGGWIWSAPARRVPYRWPELLQFPDATVFVCEGEKDADRVASLGHCATTVACSKWTDDCIKALAGRDCFVLEDNDETGRKKAHEAASALRGTAKSVRVVRLPDLPDKGDVSDWLDADKRRAGAFVDVCFTAPLWDATKEQPEQTEMPRQDYLRTAAAEDLEMRAIDWLWPDRFALGKIGLIAGLPDYGKGQIGAFLAAAVTANVELPCQEGSAPQGNVIWLNAEDDARDTVKPRLVAAGADCKRVYFVNGVHESGKERAFNLVTDLHLLRKKIAEIGNVLLVIIDPMSAYLGIGKVDSRSATDVRGLLSPLKELAEDLHVVVIGIAHFNKKDDIKSALLRVSDSIAYVAAARHVYAVLDDPEAR